MTKIIRQKSDYERKGTDITSYPCQYDNADYGVKRKAKTKNVVVKNTTTGKVYGYKTVEEGMADTVYPNAIVIRTKRGQEVGEIYQTESGDWGCFHYKVDSGYDGMDTKEEAYEELKQMHDEYRYHRNPKRYSGESQFRPMESVTFKDIALNEMASKWRIEYDDGTTEDVVADDRQHAKLKAHDQNKRIKKIVRVELNAISESATITDHTQWVKECRRICPDCQFTPSSYSGVTPRQQQAVWWNNRDNPLIGEWHGTYGEVFSMNEATETDTRYPNGVISEITGLIRKGAKDLEQRWKNAFELVHTAFHVANVKRPTPDKKGAWKQYEELLKVAVRALFDARGNGDWRMSGVAYHPDMELTSEMANCTPELDQFLAESTDGRKHRIFVKVRDIGYEDEEKEHEVEADGINDVIHSMLHHARKNGRHLHIEPLDKGHVRLTVHVKGTTGKTRDEQIIHVKDWSL